MRMPSTENLAIAKRSLVAGSLFALGSSILLMAVARTAAGEAVAAILVPGVAISLALGGEKLGDSGFVLGLLIDWMLYSIAVFPLFWLINRLRKRNPK